MNTNLDIFVKLVHEQFRYGGIKYANTNTKESTDILVDDYGWNWLIGTNHKYVFRYNNLKRERDLLKIACYQFIKWLKLGYHKPGLKAWLKRVTNYLGFGFINTTVDVKSRYFPVFVGRVRHYELDGEQNRQETLNELGENLLRLRYDKREKVLLKVFRLCFLLWKIDGFSELVTHDEDTWNENQKKENKNG